ncbi:MAG: DUF4175 family protein [bacterium]
MMKRFVNKIRLVYFTAVLGLFLGNIGVFVLSVFSLAGLASIFLYVLSDNINILVFLISSFLVITVGIFIYEMIIYVRSLKHGFVWSLIEKRASVPKGRIRGVYEVCLQALSGYNFSKSFTERAQDRVRSSVKFVFPITKPFMRYSYIMLLFLFVFIIYSGINPKLLVNAYDRIIDAYENIFLPQSAVFTIEPKGALIHKGDDLNVVVKLSRKTDYKPLIEVDRGLNNIERIDMVKVDSYEYCLRLKGITENILYRGVLGKKVSDWYRVIILKEPFLRGLVCKITSPEYSNIQPIIRKSIEGQIFCLSGSSLSFEVDVNGDVDGVGISIGDRMIGLNKGGDNIFRGNLTVYSSGEIVLISKDKLGVYKTLETGMITITTDEKPFIKLVSPKKSATVSTDLIMRLSYEAGDDYGISSIGAEYIIETTDESGKFLLGNGDGRRYLSGEVSFDLHKVDMLPGDIVSIRLYALDNDNVNGPKIAYSDVVKVKIPDIVQFFKSVDSDREYVDIEDVLKEGQTISDKLEEIVKNFEERGEIDYKSYKQMEEIIEKEKKIKSRAEDVIGKIGEMKKMGEEGFLSEETLYKLSKAQQMLQELIDEQTRLLLEKLQEILKDLPNDEIEKAMLEIVKNQEELSRRLDNLLEFLKNAKVETMLDSLKEKLERMIEKQDRITEELKKMKGEEKGEISERQRNIKEEYNEFKKDIEELMKEAGGMSELSNEIKELMGKGLIEKPLENMNEMLVAIGDDNISKATSSSISSANSMKDLYKMLGGLTSNFLERQREDIISALNSAESEISQISKMVDILEEYSKQGDMKKTRDVSEKLTNRLTPIKEQLQNIMSKTLFLNPLTLKFIESAQKFLNELSSAESPSEMAEGLTKVEESLMNTRMFIAEAIESVKGAQTPSGLSDFLSSLGKIISDQGQFGRSLMDYLRGQGSFDYNSLLQMAGMQRVIRESLEKLLERYQSLSEALEGLNSAVMAMKKIEGMLSKGVSAERIKEEQEHLMENLLRSEKAIKSRGISRERKSTPGKDYIDTSVPQILPLGVDEKKILRTPPLDLPSTPSVLGERNLIETYLKYLVE